MHVCYDCVNVDVVLFLTKKQGIYTRLAKTPIHSRKKTCKAASELFKRTPPLLTMLTFVWQRSHFYEQIHAANVTAGARQAPSTASRRKTALPPPGTVSGMMIIIVIIVIIMTDDVCLGGYKMYGPKMNPDRINSMPGSGTAVVAGDDRVSILPSMSLAAHECVCV